MPKVFSLFQRLVPSSVLLIVLGFVLSPALLGGVAPDFSAWIRRSFPELSLLAQIGLALFVFGVGMHFDKKAVWRNIRDDRFRMVTFSSLVLPGFAGFVFGYVLFQWHPEYAAQAGIWTFGCVNAIIFATAAVPVLCAILKRLKVLEAYRETVVIAMIGDVLLWNALGLLGTDSGMGALKATIGLIVIIGVGFTVGTKILDTCEVWVFKFVARGVIGSRGKHALFFCLAILVLCLCAFSTHWVGAHILPGAFLAGLLLSDRMKTVLLFSDVDSHAKGSDSHLHPSSLIEKCAAPLMVIFFLLPGLRFQGDLWQPSVWQLGAVYSLLATASKVTSVFFPALLIAQVSMKRALNMSLFLNTRGTMEIVAVSELYKLGLLSPEVFVAVIIMTLVCTAITVPGVYVVWWRYPEKQPLPCPGMQKV